MRDTELTSLILEANVDSSENGMKSRPWIVGFLIGGVCMYVCLEDLCLLDCIPAWAQLDGLLLQTRLCNSV